jgi:AcrR family transcriptional regulator
MPQAKYRYIMQPDRRELILQAALRLFGSNGYFNTSVHDIRREAEVSIGTIYHYFPSKEAIAKALYRKLVTEMSNDLEQIIAARSSVRDCSRAIISYLFEKAESSPEEMHFIMYARHQEFMPSEKPICSSEPFELIMRMVQKGIAREELIAIDPAVATTSIFGGAMRLIHLRLDKALQKPLTTYLEETWRCGWRAVKLDKA